MKSSPRSTPPWLLSPRSPRRCPHPHRPVPASTGRAQHPPKRAPPSPPHPDSVKSLPPLIDHFGFDEYGVAISVLSDTDPATSRLQQPTGANICRELVHLITDARLGDSLSFHYSGHGTRLPAETGQDDDTGYDECIVPSDLNLITGF